MLQTMWISSKTNSEFFTASTDGTVMWWDIRWAEYWSTIPLPDCDITSWSITLVSPRKFTSPVETLIIDPKATEDTGNTDKVCATNKTVFWSRFKLFVNDNTNEMNVQTQLKKFHLSLLQLSQQVKSSKRSFVQNWADPSSTFVMCLQSLWMHNSQNS